MKPEERFWVRRIRPEEAETAADIEEICFPPNEACPRAVMRRRALSWPETFLVAQERESGQIAGMLNGIATDETVFRDAFFTDPGLHCPGGSNLMLLGLDVLPAFRKQGLARLLLETCRREAEAAGRSRLVLTCLAEKVPMYEHLGFADLGLSASRWGGEAWHEMDLRLDGKANADRA